MSDRLRKNLSLTVLGAAYIMGGAIVTHVSRFLSPALIIIGVCLVGVVVVNLLTPSNAVDLHFKP